MEAVVMSHDRLDRVALDKLLLKAVELQASDVHLQTKTAVYADIHGKMALLSPKRLQAHELQQLTNEILGAHATAKLAQGEPLNSTYEVRPDRLTRLRFRVNAHGCYVDGAMDGIQVTLRVIPNTPPTVEDLDVEPEILAGVEQRQGLIAITGATGSGKSTLIAALIRRVCENPDAHQKIITYEAPIEFTYDTLVHPSTFISQSEVPRHVPSFHVGVEEALRRKPTMILVGESRGPETISATCVAAQTGHVVLTTVHTNSVPETIQRMVSVFSPEERAFHQANLIEAFRMIVTQTLVPSTDDKRVALREYLIFDETTRDTLLNTDPIKLSSVARQLVKERGRSMLDDARSKFAAGRISQHTYNVLQKSFGGA